MAHPESSNTPSTLGDLGGIPWKSLAVRIGEAIHRRHYFVASSEDLRVLWQGERVDASERRRRIMVFAAQHHWKVETRQDGGSARFVVPTPSGLISLSRNPE